jgi:hypothetical protein
MLHALEPLGPNRSADKEEPTIPITRANPLTGDSGHTEAGKLVGRTPRRAGEVRHYFRPLLPCCL